MTALHAPIHTIGHSTHPLDAFLALLAEARIDYVIDVRRLPGSRRFPHYNADALAASLTASSIGYRHALALCGRRTRGDLEGRAPEAFWTNASFARYAAWTRGAAFTHALQTLIEQANVERCVLMCAEAVWWRCHRRIIADHLLARGVPVLHILGEHDIVAATLTTGAQILNGDVVYPTP